MRRLCRGGSRGALGILFVVAGLAGCSAGGGGGGGGGGNGPDGDGAADVEPAEVVTREGRVDLPAGMAVDPAELRAVNALGSSVVSADGSCQVDAFEDLPQMTIITSPSGEPMMLGWLTGDAPAVSCRSTAEVLVYFALKCYLLPEGAQALAIEALAEASELDPLAEAMAESLAADPDSLSRENPTVHAAIVQAVADLAGSFGVEKAPPRESILVNPSEERSGVRVDHTAAINTIQVVNGFRRRGFVFIEQQSYVRESDGVTVPEVRKHSMSDFWMSPVLGVGEGVLDTFSDIFMWAYGVGTLAYEPVSSDPIELPLRSGSARTTYQVKVVGAGVSAGDAGRLNHAESLMMYVVWATTLGQDILLPAMANVVMPIRNYGGFESFISSSENSDVFEDFVNAVKDSPGAMDAMAEGRTTDALVILWKHLSYDTSALRTAAVQALGRVVDQAVSAGYLKEVRLDQYVKAVQLAGQIFNGLNVADIILGSVDLGVSVVHIGMSNHADIWTVEVTEANVVLDPEESEIDLFGQVTLTATVTDATGSGPAPAFTYRWHNTGNAGSIADARHTSNDFDSSSDTISYLADVGEPGADTITVQVYQLDDSEKTYVGEAVATVTVRGTSVDIDPPESKIRFGKSATLTAEVIVWPPLGSDEALVYVWSNTASFGHLTGGATATDDFETGDPEVLYTAGDTDEGTDTITIEAFREKAGERTSVDRASATVEVVEQLEYGIVLVADPTEVEADGVSCATVTATLRKWQEDDASEPTGDLVPDREVDFHTTLGTLIGDNPVLTAADGTATIALVSSIEGTATVRASVEEDLVESNLVEVRFGEDQDLACELSVRSWGHGSKPLDAGFLPLEEGSVLVSAEPELSPDDNVILVIEGGEGAVQWSFPDGSGSGTRVELAEIRSGGDIYAEFRAVWNGVGNAGVDFSLYSVDPSNDARTLIGQTSETVTYTDLVRVYTPCEYWEEVVDTQWCCGIRTGEVPAPGLEYVKALVARDGESIYYEYPLLTTGEFDDQVQMYLDATIGDCVSAGAEGLDAHEEEIDELRSQVQGAADGLESCMLFSDEEIRY